ncbi:hypothetical protein Pcinc_034121 [Petrolisthes cinctipes]|uniref:Uncharacterized protein n=1 Tax=Petrolisthes cinctipes TaxID=88211 RepID=A0AAE1EQU6_PETCI|nr:hypothetical protein Pcinc_034121 [Petrolisthes cinctipes]
MKRVEKRWVTEWMQRYRDNEESREKVGGLEVWRVVDSGNLSGCEACHLIPQAAATPDPHTTQGTQDTQHRTQDTTGHFGHTTGHVGHCRTLKGTTGHIEHTTGHVGHCRTF